jgi:ABC-type multidrug transport system fused ATPase/permease subunit
MTTAPQVRAVSLIHYWRVFWGTARWRLVALWGIVLVGGAVEGVGLTMLIPILDIGTGGVPHRLTVAIQDALAMVGLPSTLPVLLGVLFMIFLVKAGILFLQATVSVSITTELIRSQRVRLLEHYARMEYSYFTRVDTGRLHNALTTEVDRSVHGFGKYVDLLVGGTYLLVYLALAAMLEWQITIVVLVVALFLFRILRILSTIARRLSLLVSHENASIQSLALQLLAHFKYLKATNAFPILLDRLRLRIGSHRRAQFLNGILSAVPTAITEPLAVLLLSGLIFYAVIVQGQPMAAMLVLLIFFYRAFTRVFSIQSAWQKFWATIGGVEVLAKLEPELTDAAERDGTVALHSLENAVVFEGVTVRYGDTVVLADISMTIPRGSTIGIVGPSGAGKTTLFDCVLGLVDASEGRMTYDGVLYDRTLRASLRSQMGYVTQDPVLFRDSIANNITMWQDDPHDAVTREKIFRAATSANCMEFISQLPDGILTQVGDRGATLSGGQRQRIAIARELYKDVSVLCFDEATSALDAVSEAMIQESIRLLRGSKTVLIAAHRLSTLRICDRIVVLEAGRIVEEGGYFSLITDPGSRFARMHQAQQAHPHT